MINRFIKTITNKPMDISHPIFEKDFIPRTKHIEELEELLIIADDNSKVNIENEIKMIKYGSYGEQNICYELKNSFIPMICLHDIRIEYKGLSAQIDFIAITAKKIYVIEGKNIAGDLLINDKGEFIRYKKNSNGSSVKEGMYSPVVQNERHIELLQLLLKEKLKYKRRLDRIESLIVISNPKTVINKKYAPKNIKNKVIRYDQLVDILKSDEKNKHLEWVFIQSEIMEIVNCLKEHHKEMEIDYKKKFKISSKSVKKYNNDEELMKMLKEFRLSASKRDKVKPYEVFNNKEMDEIIKIKPTKVEDMRCIKGFKYLKCDNYGSEIIELIN